MAYWFATLKAEPTSLRDLASELASNEGMRKLPTEARDDGSIWVGRTAPDTKRFPKLIDAVFTLFVASAGMHARGPFTIELLFSGIKTTSSALGAIVDLWAETGEPPVMSMIGFQIAVNKQKHVTVGLEPFLGSELAVNYGDPIFGHDALRDLARLVRHVLMGGQAEVGMQFAGVNADIPFTGKNAVPCPVKYWFSCT